MITGGSGFCGVHLAARLIRDGYRVRILDTATLNMPRLEKSVEFVQADVRDASAAAKACEGIDVIFHMAAILPVSRSGRRTFYDVNVNGTVNILESSLKKKARRAVFISSSAVYGVPKEAPINESTRFCAVEDYGRSKIEAEKACRAYRKKGLDTVILRPRTILGKGRLGIFHILFNWIAEGDNIYLIGRGDNPIQFLSVGDFTEACALAIGAPCRDEDINIGADSFGTIREDLEGLIDYAGTGSGVVSLPAWPAKAALAVLDKVDLSPLTAWHYLTYDKSFYFDTGKARRALGFGPSYSNLDMLRESYDWYLARKEGVDAKIGVTHRHSAAQRMLRAFRRRPKG